MTLRDAFNEIRNMDLPGRAKAELLMLFARSRRLGEQMLAFIRRHKDLAECLLLGAIVAFLLAKLPWLGGFLALLALVSAAAVGLMLEMRNYLADLFAMPVV